MKLCIIGIGPGHREYMLPKAVDAIKKCDIILGFNRVIQSLEWLQCNKKSVLTLGNLIEEIKSCNSDVIGVVASGDPTFYGISNYLSKNFQCDIEIIPGLSSFQYLTCKLNKPWNNGFVGSLHGREQNFIEAVKKNNLSIWLTDKINNPTKLCNELSENNISCVVFIGENLSYEHERILIGAPIDFVDSKFDELSVFIVETLK